MMRKMMSVFLFLLLTLGCAACTAEEANTVKVKITVGEQVLYADFADNATSRYLMEKMPMTLPMMDLYGREMCYRFSGEDIPAEEARYGAFDVGKILYWTPWHSFVIVYAESDEEIDNLQYVGEIEAGVALFAETGDCEVTFELAEDNVMKLTIGETEVPVTWEDNASVDALRELLPLTIQMSMYGGFEQVGPIGQRIVRDDKQTTTNSGDIVLYSGNQIVVFYGSNSWAYTRLGHVDLSQQEMRDLLGHGDVTITMKEE